MKCVSNGNNSLCEPLYCHGEGPKVLNGKMEFPIQANVSATLERGAGLPSGYVGQLTCDQGFVVEGSETGSSELSITCNYDATCGHSKWTTLKGGKIQPFRSIIAQNLNTNKV